jgi:diguanylate cyclase (GGDEF)-like protein/PAS domain S-box-containing protein
MITNKLLRRQIKRCFGVEPEEAIPALPGAFLARIDESYRQYERDIELRTHSLDISTQELEEANQRLRSEIHAREQALERLRQSATQLLSASRFVHDPADTSDTLENLSQLIGDLVEERLHLEASLRSNEGQFRDLAEMSSDWFWEQDREFRFTKVSASISRSAVEPDSILGKTRWELPIIASDTEWKTHRRMLEMHLPFQDFLFRAEPRPGQFRWFSITGRPIFGSEGEFLGYRGIGRDITAQRKAQDELRLAASVFEASAEAVMVTDAGRRILAVNPAFETITGYCRSEAIGQTPRILSSDTHDQEFYQRLWETIARDGHWQGEIWDRRKTGEIIAISGSISAVKDGSGAIYRYVSVFSDVSDRKQAEEQISFLAHHDPLTGLPNRTLMEDRLKQAIALAERNGSSLAVLFIDLDNFKTINDSLGHHIGDLVLQQVADRLRECVRKSDTVCRLGGDEFLVILDAIIETEDAARVASKILASLAEQCTIDGNRLHVTPSIGISVYPQDGSDPVSLLKNADVAMYHAKNHGRNLFHFFTQDLNAKASERLALESNLRRGLDAEEFLLHYQPQVDALSGRVIGLEALVRWRHPEWGMVSPARFIPVAEESGLIIPLGEWILRDACRQGRIWQQGGWNIPIAVNISALQFRHKAFLETVLRALADYPQQPGCLVLELTEGVLMTDSDDNDALLRQLKNMGISLAVDDFGTGYSSLAYLKRFPIDKLKIDQSFVRDLTSDSADAEIVKAIIALSHALGLGVIAEGVETAEQRIMLGAMGANVCQGYFFHMPLSVEALEPLVPPQARRA